MPNKLRIIPEYYHCYQ